MKAPGKFPGLNKLPDPVRKTVEFFFPQPELTLPVSPMPMQGIIKPGLRQMLLQRLEQQAPDPSNPFMSPSHDQATLKRLMEAFRPKDLSNVLPSTPSKVPAAPDTVNVVGGSLGEYETKVADILRRLKGR